MRPVPTLLLASLTGFLVSTSAPAQHGGGNQPHMGHAGAASPYAGLQTRGIKALSEKEVEDLRAGRGMGLALAAELNGYPGPLHVIELASPLALTDSQLASMHQLLAAMKEETSSIGERIIASETHLDRMFRDKTATVETVNRATSEIGRLNGELRGAHLRYHLATVRILTPEQIERYKGLRGYAN